MGISWYNVSITENYKATVGGPYHSSPRAENPTLPREIATSQAPRNDIIFTFTIISLPLRNRYWGGGGTLCALRICRYIVPFNGASRRYHVRFSPSGRPLVARRGWSSYIHSGLHPPGGRRISGDQWSPLRWGWKVSRNIVTGVGLWGGRVKTTPLRIGGPGSQ